MCNGTASVAALLLLASTPTMAGPADKSACLHAHERGQELRMAGQWRAARASFAACSEASCPSALVKDCVEWSSELLQKQPAIVVVAKAPDGTDTTQARLLIDGVERAAAIPATQVEVDPGEHVLRVEHDGWSSPEERFVAREGERARRIEVTFADLRPPVRERPRMEPEATRVIPPPAPPPPRRSWTRPVWVLGGVGAAALAVGGGLDVSGGVDYTLGCIGHCSAQQARSINSRFLAGDVTLAGGVSLLAVAVVVGLLSAPPEGN